MSSPVEQYLAHLDRWADGTESENHLITEEGVRPPLWTFSYRDLFGDGTITGFTYGLSSVEHPEWRSGRPELCISMDSERLEWVLAVGAVAARWRGQSPFGFGEVFRLDSPINPEESQISALLLFAVTDVEPEFTRVELQDRVINLVQAYPLYESEIALLQRMGPAELLSLDEVDFHNPSRPPLA